MHELLGPVSCIPPPVESVGEPEYWLPANPADIVLTNVSSQEIPEAE